MTGCRPLELCKWLQGELEPREEAALEEHVASCASCTAEITWLRAERRLFARRARSDRSELPDFDAVLAHRTAPERPAARTGPWRGAGVALGVCAAAALLALVGPGRRGIESGLGLYDSGRVGSEPAPIVAEPLRTSDPRASNPWPPSPDGEPVDERGCSTEDGQSIETAAAPAMSRNEHSEIEDEYGACLMATPKAPHGARVELTCDAPPL